MNTIQKQPFPAARPRLAGFTMVEIAISLGVISVALVALLGVLPSGLNVQRDNRNDTVINQEGTFLLEAIRGGARVVPQLANYTDYIRITNSSLSKPIIISSFYNSDEIIGYLSLPKYALVNGKITTNTVAGRFRAMTGSLADKGTNTDFAFAYVATSEVVPYDAFPAALTNWHENNITAEEKLIRSNRWGHANLLANNLYEIRLTLRWPVRPDGSVGLGSQTFRTLASGSLKTMSATNFHFLPSQYGY